MKQKNQFYSIQSVILQCLKWFWVSCKVIREVVPIVQVKVLQVIHGHGQSTQQLIWDHFEKSLLLRIFGAYFILLCLQDLVLYFTALVLLHGSWAWMQTRYISLGTVSRSLLFKQIIYIVWSKILFVQFVKFKITLRVSKKKKCNTDIIHILFKKYYFLRKIKNEIFNYILIYT